MEFSERLKELREEKGVYQKDIAKAIGVATNTYCGYEKGTREPNFQILKAICRFYQVSSDYLLGLED